MSYTIEDAIRDIREERQSAKEGKEVWREAGDAEEEARYAGKESGLRLAEKVIRRATGKIGEPITDA